METTLTVYVLDSAAGTRLAEIATTTAYMAEGQSELVALGQEIVGLVFLAGVLGLFSFGILTALRVT